MSAINIYLFYLLLSSTCLLASAYYTFKPFSTKSLQLLRVLLLSSALLARAIPVLLTMSFNEDFVLTGSDQAFDHALTRCIQELSIPVNYIQHKLSIPRLPEYAYYPALHFTGAAISIVTSCKICAAMFIPIIEPVLLFPFLRRFIKQDVTVALLLLLLLTNGYFSIFHTQYIREVYSFLILCSLILVIARMVSGNEGSSFSGLILLIILTASFIFSHFYLRYVSLLIFHVLVYTSYKCVKLQKRFLPALNKLILLIFSLIVTYDLYIAISYALTLKPLNYIEEIMNIYQKLMVADISSPLREAVSTVGVKLPEYDKLGIIVNQSIPLALFIIYIPHILTSRNKTSLREFSFNLALIFSYYGLLLFKTLQDLYVVNIGLRASQYILLLYFIRVAKSMESMRVRYDARKRFFLLFTIITIALSVATYPNLLPPSLKGLEPSYYIPYMTAKAINPFLPRHDLRICVTAEAPGIPVSDLFNGFIYGFIPERIDLFVLRVYGASHVLGYNGPPCDIIFYTDFTEELRYGRIFDVKLFALYEFHE